MPRLTLYSRQHCHLCHEMQAQVEALRSDSTFELEVLDIDRNPALTLRFNELVPVLMAGERELARYRLDTATLGQLHEYLRDYSAQTR
jgi:hypothetical protein